MGMVAELLGVDLDSPEMRRAEILAANDRRLLAELVRIRQARGLSQAAVGEIMGVTQPTVAAFEAYDSNPRLSSIRRYAHAVGALVHHRVEADPATLAPAQTSAVEPAGTIDGTLVTEEQIEAWAAEAEAGYDLVRPLGPGDRQAPSSR